MVFLLLFLLLLLLIHFGSIYVILCFSSRIRFTKHQFCFECFLFFLEKNLISPFLASFFLILSFFWYSHISSTTHQHLFRTHIKLDARPEKKQSFQSFEIMPKKIRSSKKTSTKTILKVNEERLRASQAPCIRWTVFTLPWIEFISRSKNE